jgi:hypothetical protein
MSRPFADPPPAPERLLASDATGFERRVLEAARHNGPSAASSARMARALGVTASAAAAAVAAKALAADAAAVKVTAAAGTSAVWPWVSVAVISVVAAGAVVGTRAGRHEPEPQARPAVTSPAPSPSSPGDEARSAAARSPADRSSGPATEAAPRGTAPPHHRAALAGGDLGDQVAFIDSARSAMSAGADRSALQTLRRYLGRYPSGSFRPEAIALEVEVLMKLGREAEARTLAGRFVVEHRGSLLARRVAEVAGLAKR